MSRMLLTFNCPSLGTIERHLLRNDDYLMDAETKANIGAVVAVRTVRDGKSLYLLVKKAPVPGYVYSGMWALPGGMVRIQGSPVTPLLLPERAGERTLSETNVVIAADSLHIADGVPPATEYSVKGNDCTVIVVPFVFDAPLPEAAIADMHSNHRSIDTVQVANPLSCMADIAPANRVILARLIWPGLTSKEKDSIRETVSDAVTLSNAIAKRIGFPRLAEWF